MDFKTYESSDLKLSALLLASIPDSYFEITPGQTSAFTTFKIFFPASSQNLLEKTIQDFLNKLARVDVYLYNKQIRLLHSAIASTKEGGR